MSSAYPPPRTFQPRRRKLGTSRLAVYERMRRQFGLAVDGPPIDGCEGAILDIGFGYGAALIELARRDRSTQVIGVEVHTPGVANVFEAIESEGLTHVRVVEGDVLEFLGRVPPGSLSAIRIWFPDPWPKLRQQRRRIVRADLLDGFVHLLRPGGVLHLATDVDDYATQMRSICDAHAQLVGGVIPRPEWRPVTSFEQRALAAGRTATDLFYTRDARQVVTGQ